MEKISKDFLKGNLLICGCTKSDNAYYKRLNKHFTKNGINVLAMPTTPESELGFSTYMNYEDLPVTPDCAYVLSPKEKSGEIIDKMNELGVKKILFYGKVSADEEVLAKCEKYGMEVRMGCPLMLFAGATCYLHAMASGTMAQRREAM